jgi:DMATS type aromatic prenyltransferase
MKTDKQSLCEIVARETPFTDEDQKFWWQSTAPSLESLLSSCQYTEEEQLIHIRWYRRFIVPSLGPRPIPGVKPNFQPCPVFDGSAVEHSINWKELDPKRTVRFTIEAVGYDAGTDTDPFNQKATKTMLADMEQSIPSLDLERFNLFADRLFLPSHVATSLIPKIPSGTPLSQVWVAFDLLRGKVMAKVYFMPILKWIHTNVSTKKLVFDIAQECNGPYGSFDAPIAMLDSYIGSLPSDQTPVVEMVAIDCIESAKSRIKIYLRTAVNTLERAKKAFSLGGRLKGEAIDEGLKALEDLWHILFRLQFEDIETTKILPDGSYCGNAIEMRPGHAEPEVKLHIPVRKIEGSDAQICESLAAWFRRRGNDNFASTYKANLSTAL